MTKYILISSLLALGACGDDDDGAGAADAAGATVDAGVDPDAAVPLSIDDVCDVNDGMFVDFFNAAISCFPEFELFLGISPTDANFSDACYGQFGPFVLDGTILLGTLDDLAACQDVIDGIDCSTFEFDAPNACTSVFTGTLAAGADCDSAEQCVGDSYCDDSGSATCAVCALRKADGETCDGNDECINRRCSRSGGKGAGMCRAYGLVGDGCAGNDDCAGHLQCNAVSSMCQIAPVWAVDDVCTTNDNGDCGFPLSNLYCDEGNLVCVAYVPLGDPCTGPFQCNFIKYETCDVGVTDVCVAPTIRALNESCSFFDGDKCAVGLQCSEPGDGGTCQQPAQAGDSCTPTGNECGDFLLECVNSECQYGEYSGMCPAS